MSVVQRPPTSLGGAAAHSASRPQVAPQRLHHLAYVTGDTEATAEFYTGVLGLPLVNAVVDDHVPSTKEALPYIHSFFRLGTGETIAFFECQACRHRQPKRMPSTAPSSTWRWRCRRVKTSTPGVPGWSPAGSRSSQSITAASTASTSRSSERHPAGDHGLDRCKLECKRDQCSRRARRMDQDQTRGPGRRQGRYRRPMRARRRA